MDVSCAHTLADLEPHAAAWEALAARLPQCVPMLGHAWISTFLRLYVEPDGKWFSVFAHEHGELRGVLTVVVEPSGVLLRLRPRLRVPLHYHTTEGDPVLAPEHARETLLALLDGLRERIRRPLVLQLGGVREDSPTMGALEEGAPGWCVMREPCVQGSSWIVEGTADAWFQGLSKNLRKDLKRCANRVRKDGLGDERVTFLAKADATPELLPTLVDLEASGWKAAGSGTAIARDPRTVEKYRLLARLYAERGMLEWHVLYLGERLAAIHLAVRMGKNLMLLRQGFADDLGRYGVGNRLIQRMVEREFERGGGTEINLVTDYPWCRRWRMAERRYDRIWLHPRGVLPWLASSVPHRTGAWLRRNPAVGRLRGWRRRRAGGVADRQPLS